MDDYTAYDAVGLAQRVRSGDVTPADLLTAARTRAEQVNPRINAVVMDVEPSQTADADAAFSGVPFLIKDGCLQFILLIF